MTDKEVRFVYGSVFLLMLLFGRGVLAADQPIGTVFYSPAEREALVAERHESNTKEVGGAKGKCVDDASKSVPYTVTGIVSRSQGKSVVWINGQPVSVTPNDTSQPTLRLSNDHVVIDGKSVKVGETLDVISGERVSPLPAGAVKVAP